MVLGQNGEIHLQVADLQQQIGYLLQERNIVNTCSQNPDPAEQRKGETTRLSEQQRFTAIQENQRAVYDEIVKAEATPIEPDAQAQLAQDKGALLEQVQLLQGLGYEYTMGAPGQPVPCTYIYVIYIKEIK